MGAGASSNSTSKRIAAFKKLKEDYEEKCRDAGISDEELFEFIQSEWSLRVPSASSSDSLSESILEEMMKLKMAKDARKLQCAKNQAFVTELQRAIDILDPPRGKSGTVLRPRTPDSTLSGPRPQTPSMKSPTRRAMTPSNSRSVLRGGETNDQRTTIDPMTASGEESKLEEPHQIEGEEDAAGQIQESGQSGGDATSENVTPDGTERIRRDDSRSRIAPTGRGAKDADIDNAEVESSGSSESQNSSVCLEIQKEVNPEVVDTLLHQLEEIQQNVRTAVSNREAESVLEWAGRRTQLAIQSEQQLIAQSTRLSQLMATNKETIECLNSTLTSVEDLLNSIRSNNIEVDDDKDEDSAIDKEENLRELLQDYVNRNFLVPSEDLESKKINHLFRKWAGARDNQTALLTQMPKLSLDSTPIEESKSLVSDFLSSVETLSKVKQSIVEKIRNITAQVKVTVKEASLELLQLAQSTKRQLGMVFHRFEDEASNLQVLHEQTQKRLSYVSILAGTKEDHRQGLLNRLTEIDETILEYEDQRDEMALDVKKKLRRKADLDIVTSAKAELARAEKNLKKAQKEKREVLSELARMTHESFPELVMECAHIAYMPGNSFVAPKSVHSSLDSDVLHMSSETLDMGSSNEHSTGEQIERHHSILRRKFDEYSEVTASDRGSERHPIYKAKIDGRTVILKGFAQHNANRRRELDKEIRVLSQLRHEALIAVGAIVVDEVGRPPTVYLELPYFDGGNLGEWIKKKTRTPWQMQSILHQVLCGIVHLHDHQIVHKDIKPANILIQNDNRAVITDFELSRDMTRSASTSYGVRAGTQGYIAPEVQDGGQCSYASDMYAIGVLMFEMHFGRLPVPDVRNKSELFIPDHPNSHLVNLLGSLLSTDPSRRPSANTVLMSSYFRVSLVEDLVSTGELVDRNKKLAAVRDLFAKIRNKNGWRNDAELAKWHLKRSELVHTALKYFGEMPPDKFRQGFRVVFEGEVGVDAGGLLTEFYTIFFTEIVQPGFNLFETACEKGLTARQLFLPTPWGDKKQLETIGRMMVKCMYDGRRIGNMFAPSLFKALAMVKPTFRDLEHYDPSQAHSLRWILANDNGASVCNCTFEGLCEDGDSISLTEDNKHEFVDLKVQHILVDSRQAGLEAFAKGFEKGLKDVTEEAYPFLQLLSNTDLRLLVCGQEYVSAEQIINTLTFSNCPSDHAVIGWLKKLLRSMSDDNLRRFLIFVTGSPSLPTDALGKTTIKVRCKNSPRYPFTDKAQQEQLPTAHSCFNFLDMPFYSTEQQLQKKFMQAIELSAVGYGLE